MKYARVLSSVLIRLCMLAWNCFPASLSRLKDPADVTFAKSSETKGTEDPLTAWTTPSSRDSMFLSRQPSVEYL